MISKILDLLPITQGVSTTESLRTTDLISAVPGVKIFSLPLSWICSYDIPELKISPMQLLCFSPLRKSSGRLLWIFILFLQLFLSIPQSLSSTSLPSQNRTPDLSFAFAKFLPDLIFGLNKITLFQSLSWRYSIFWSSHGQKNIKQHIMWPSTWQV